MRISELCALKNDNMNLYDGTILIYGKGDKERRIQIGNESVINILQESCTRNILCVSIFKPAYLRAFFVSFLSICKSL